MSLKKLFSRSTDGEMTDRGMIGPPSPRSVKRKMMLITLAGLLALSGVAAASYYYAVRPVTLRIAVGPSNSDDAKVVQALTQAFARDSSRIRLRPLVTDGALASATALADGKSDLAIIRGDLDVPKNAQAVATLRKNVAVLWVPTAAGAKSSGDKSSDKPAKAGAAADDEDDDEPASKAKPAKAAKGKAKSDTKSKAAAKAAPAAAKAPLPITKISQLAGRKVGVVGRTSANVNLLKVILQQYAVDPAKVEVVQFSTSEVADAVRVQKVDAFMAAGPVNSKITTEAIAASIRDGGSATFLPIDLADAIAQNYPAYEAAEIPAGAFGGSPDRPDDEVKTISFAHHVVARHGLSDSTIASFARQLFAARQTLMADFPLAAKIETPDTDKDAFVPVHPGAAAYVDGEEKSFLDRYSDYIWFALIALSSMGSIGAWLASYLRKDERNTNTSLRERLLDMLGTARASTSLEELDQMQAEADGILRNTLTCFEHGAVDEGSLTAFNIALEQFHNAVADRKALLGVLPQATTRPSVQLLASGGGL